MKMNYVLLLLFLTTFSKAQEVRILTLEECQKAAIEQYPSTKKKELISKSLEYSISNISKGYLPQLSGVNQLSWQSDVTKFPVSIPGVDMPEISQTQYKAYTDVNQLIFDGGVIKNRKKTEQAINKIDLQSVEVELYAVKDRVNNLYFGILLLDEQAAQNELLKTDIKIGLKTVEAQIINGTAFRSSAEILKAELLKAELQAIEIKNSKIAFVQMLSLFTGFEINEKSIFEKPVPTSTVATINRPELQLFDYKNQKLDADKKLISIRDTPKISLFAQSGMSNPGLNMFEEGVQSYFIGGIRLNWSMSFTKKKEKAILDIKKEMNNADRETFLFNTNQQLKQQNAEISKLQEFIDTDAKIIMLRSSIKKASLAQLENGVIDSNDYLQEVNEENKAMQNKKAHEIELLMALYKEKTITGN
ncbi:TolC family protein [Flavobacterium sp.]|uniref:TolC family protein n=1 Tax=Flavobacterium sp. TaxID=239 RepID=UPI0028BEBF94|nr:TolC family protein [Flavobacterium sp.]